LAIDRVLRPAAASRTIRARFKSRCNVTGERQHASSTLRSFRERWTSLASGIIPTLNHHSRLGYPRSGLERSDFVRWHFSDMVGLRLNVG
jgi:hypothetical protein